MGVERGGAGGTMFIVRKNFRKPELFLAPVGVVHVEHLGHRAPADIFYERGFFLRGRRSFLGIELPQRFDCRDVFLELLFWPAVAQAVSVGDAIAVEILRRFFLMAAGYC